MLDESQPYPVENDPNDYIRGTIKAIDGSGNHIIMLANLKEAGNNSAAIAATHMLRSFSTIKDILIVGICGGTPAPSQEGVQVRLGDIVVSSPEGVLQYDRGKLKDGVIELRGSAPKPSPRFVGVANALESKRIAGEFPWEGHIAKGEKLEEGLRPSDDTDRLLLWNGKELIEAEKVNENGRREGQPRIHFGRIGAANIVLKDVELRDKLRKDHNVIAIEMESSGIADTAWAGGKDYYVIRSVCDYCDPEKNDRWQGYAAVAAAAYARSLIESISLKPANKP